MPETYIIALELKSFAILCYLGNTPEKKCNNKQKLNNIEKVSIRY